MSDWRICCKDAEGREPIDQYQVSRCGGWTIEVLG